MSLSSSACPAVLSELPDPPGTSVPSEPFGAEDALPGGLWDAVLHLTEEQRAAVTLYYYEDLPVAEIARVLGVAQGTVKSRLGRARQRLKEQLQEEDKI